MSRKLILPSSPKDAAGAYLPVPPPPKPLEFKLEEFLFDKQLKFVRDPRPFKSAVCSRRSGKTVACAADLIDTALNHPETVSLYITLSRNNAKKIVWPELLRIVRKYKLIPEKLMKTSIDKTELSITFPNGSMVYCSGAKDSSEIDKFRGLALKKVYIDECQSFRDYIQELIDDILSPALMDHAGTLCLIGTPGPIPSGYFAEIAGVVQEKKSQSDAWAHHFWTFWDNPHLPAVKSGKFTHQQLLDRELHRRGVKVDDPSIQREFFGRWVLDSDSLWIKYAADKNHYDARPTAVNGKPIRWTYLLGIDLGFDDADALAVLAWSEDVPETYLVEEVVADKQGITELVESILTLEKKYDIAKMVIDTGGLGKKIAEEMRRRHHIPVQMADKARKQENVAFLNDALRTSRFKAKSASRFAQDSHLVEKDLSKCTPDKIVLSDRYHSDIIDAVLYAFKESPAFTFEEVKAKPAVGSKEWAEAQQSELFEEAMQHFQEQAEIERRYSGQSD